MFSRLLKTPSKHSFFLFGPRQTGKTTFLKEQFKKKNIFEINLLLPESEEQYSVSPQILYRQILALKKKPDWVFIDEIQKVPALLDIVHLLIEEKGLSFALTGSSARKLRRGGANLLAGRAFIKNLHPLTFRELGEDFDLAEALRFGSLPALADLDSQEEKAEFLRAYAHTYLKEEIVVEQLIRKVPPFRKFLEVAAQTNGKIVNMDRLGREVGVNAKTIQQYFEILEDTLIGFLLPGFHTSVRKQFTLSPKFYFFDPGVKRALEGVLHLPLEERSYGFGNAFEHGVILELRRLADYAGRDWSWSHLRSATGKEVDLVLDCPGEGRHFIEIKSSTKPVPSDIKYLSKVQKESAVPGKAILACRVSKAQQMDNVLCLPWQDVPGELGL